MRKVDRGLEKGKTRKLNLSMNSLFEWMTRDTSLDRHKHTYSMPKFALVDKL